MIVLLLPIATQAQQTPTFPDFAGQIAALTGTMTIHVARDFLTMDPNRPRAQPSGIPCSRDRSSQPTQ